MHVFNLASASLVILILFTAAKGITLPQKWCRSSTKPVIGTTPTCTQQLSGDSKCDATTPKIDKNVATTFYFMVDKTDTSLKMDYVNIELDNDKTVNVKILDAMDSTVPPCVNKPALKFKKQQFDCGLVSNMLALTIKGTSDFRVCAMSAVGREIDFKVLPKMKCSMSKGSDCANALDKSCTKVAKIVPGAAATNGNWRADFDELTSIAYVTIERKGTSPIGINVRTGSGMGKICKKKVNITARIIKVTCLAVTKHVMIEVLDKKTMELCNVELRGKKVEAASVYPSHCSQSATASAAPKPCTIAIGKSDGSCTKFSSTGPATGTKPWFKVFLSTYTQLEAVRIVKKKKTLLKSFDIQYDGVVCSSLKDVEFLDSIFECSGIAYHFVMIQSEKVEELELCSVEILGKSIKGKKVDYYMKSCTASSHIGEHVCERALTDEASCSAIGAFRSKATDTTPYWTAKLKHLMILQLLRIKKLASKPLKFTITTDDDFVCSTYEGKDFTDKLFECSATTRNTKISATGGQLEICYVEAIGIKIKGQEINDASSTCKQSAKPTSAPASDYAKCENAMSSTSSGCSKTLTNSGSGPHWTIFFTTTVLTEAVRISLKATDTMSFDIRAKSEHDMGVCAEIRKVKFSTRAFTCSALATEIKIQLTDPGKLELCNVAVIGQKVPNTKIGTIDGECTQSSSQDKDHGCEKAFTKDCAQFSRTKAGAPGNPWIRVRLGILTRGFAVTIKKRSSTVWSFRILTDGDTQCAIYWDIDFHEKSFVCEELTETVKIELLNNNQLEICTIVVHGVPTPENRIRLGVCKESSYFDVSTKCANAKKVSQTCGASVFKSKNEENPYWRVNLDRVTKISGVRIVKKDDNKLMQFRILIDSANEVCYSSPKIVFTNKIFSCNVMASQVTIQLVGKGILEMCSVMIIGTPNDGVPAVLGECEQDGHESVATKCEKALVSQSSKACEESATTANEKTWWSVHLKTMTSVQSVTIIKKELLNKDASFEIHLATEYEDPTTKALTKDWKLCASGSSMDFEDKTVICKGVAEYVKITRDGHGDKGSLRLCSVKVHGIPMSQTSIQGDLKGECKQSSEFTADYNCKMAQLPGCANRSKTTMADTDPFWETTFNDYLVQVSAVRITKQSKTPPIAFELITDGDNICGRYPFEEFTDRVFDCRAVTKKIKIKLIDAFNRNGPTSGDKHIDFCSVKILGRKILYNIINTKDCKQSPAEKDKKNSCEKAIGKAANCSATSKTADDKLNAYWEVFLPFTTHVSAVRILRPPNRPDIGITIETETNEICARNDGSAFTDRTFPCTVIARTLRVSVVGRGGLEMCHVQVLGRLAYSVKQGFSKCFQSSYASLETHCEHAMINEKCVANKISLTESKRNDPQQWIGSFSKPVRVDAVEIHIRKSDKPMPFRIMLDDRTICAYSMGHTFSRKVFTCTGITTKIIIERADKGALEFCAVIVLGQAVPGLKPNLVDSGTCSQISIFKSDQQYDCDKAITVNKQEKCESTPNSAARSITTSKKDPWWMLKLTRLTEIQAITICNGLDKGVEPDEMSLEITVDHGTVCSRYFKVKFRCKTFDCKTVTKEVKIMVKAATYLLKLCSVTVIGREIQDKRITLAGCKESSMESSATSCKESKNQKPQKPSSPTACAKTSKTKDESVSTWIGILKDVTFIRAVTVQQPVDQVLNFDVILDDGDICASLRGRSFKILTIVCNTMAKLVEIRRMDHGILELCAVEILGSIKPGYPVKLGKCEMTSMFTTKNEYGCENAKKHDVCSSTLKPSKTNAHNNPWYLVHLASTTKVESVMIVWPKPDPAVLVEIKANNDQICSRQLVHVKKKYFTCEAVAHKITITALYRNSNLELCSVRVIGQPVTIGKTPYLKCKQDPEDKKVNDCTKAMEEKDDCKTLSVTKLSTKAAYWLGEFNSSVQLSGIRIVKPKSRVAWNFDIIIDDKVVCNRKLGEVFSDKVFTCNALVTKSVKIQKAANMKDSLEVCSVQPIGLSVKRATVKKFSDCKQSSDMSNKTNCKQALKNTCKNDSVSKTKPEPEAHWTGLFDKILILEAVKIKLEKSGLQFRIVTDGNHVCYSGSYVQFQERLFPCSAATKSVKIESLTGAALELCYVEALAASVPETTANLSTCTESSKESDATNCNKAIDAKGDCASGTFKTDSKASEHWWEVEFKEKFDIEAVEITKKDDKKPISLMMITNGDNVCASINEKDFDKMTFKCQASAVAKFRIEAMKGSEPLELCNVKISGNTYVPPPVQWTSWEEWTNCSDSGDPCSKTVRNRTCENYISGGEECPGNDSESKECDAKACALFKNNGTSDDGGKLAWWVWLLIVLGILLFLGIIGIIAFFFYRKHQRENDPEYQAKKKAEEEARARAAAEAALAAAAAAEAARLAKEAADAEKVSEHSEESEKRESTGSEGSEGSVTSETPSERERRKKAENFTPKYYKKNATGN